MKKNLRSKRYIRSRASVEIGRDKKRVRKAQRSLLVLRQALSRIEPYLRELSDSMAKVFRNIALSFAIPKKILDE